MAATKIPFDGSEIYAIIPNDSDRFTPALSALFVGGATGDVSVVSLKRSAEGVNTASTVVYSSVAAGGVISGIGPITGVTSTNTTATGIIGIK